MLNTLPPAAPAVKPTPAAFTLPADLKALKLNPLYLALFADDEPRAEADQGDDEPDNYGLFDGSEW